MSSTTAARQTFPPKDANLAERLTTNAAYSTLSRR